VTSFRIAFEALSIGVDTA